MDTQVANETITALLATSATITERMTTTVGLRGDLLTAREELTQARADYDAALGAATMAAYASGEITGKNQAERDVQLDAWLRNNAPLAEAKALRMQCELRVTRLELAVETAENEIKALVYTLQATQHAATLQAAMIGYEQATLGVTQRDEERAALVKAMAERQAQRANARPMPDRVKSGADADLYM